MKKTILIFVLFSLLLFACDASSNSPSEGTTSGRDLSTPSSRLVGHWTGFGKYDLFFTALDSKELGKMTVYNTDTGGTIYFTYFTLEESPRGKNLSILPILEGEYVDEGPFSEPEDRLTSPIFDFKIAKDGLTAIIGWPNGEMELSYVDDKTTR